MNIKIDKLLLDLLADLAVSKEMTFDAYEALFIYLTGDEPETITRMGGYRASESHAAPTLNNSMPVIRKIFPDFEADELTKKYLFWLMMGKGNSVRVDPHDARKWKKHISEKIPKPGARIKLASGAIVVVHFIERHIIGTDLNDFIVRHSSSQNILAQSA